jgi:hypothetical protein
MKDMEKIYFLGTLARCVLTEERITSAEAMKSLTAAT